MASLLSSEPFDTDGFYRQLLSLAPLVLIMIVVDLFANNLSPKAPVLCCSIPDSKAMSELT
jgi:hypothetical protein